MFNNISWQGYWTVLALLAAGYYLVIYLLYFRNDFKVSFGQLPAGAGAPDEPLFQKTEEDFNDDPEQEHVDRLTESCLDEISAYFEQSKRNKCVKEELIYSLQVLLRKYASVKNSSYRNAVNNVIANHAEHNCSIHLSGEEVDHLWLG